MTGYLPFASTRRLSALVCGASCGSDGRLLVVGLARANSLADLAFDTSQVPPTRSWG
jgi:hypothetical protein